MRVKRPLAGEMETADMMKVLESGPIKHYTGTYPVGQIRRISPSYSRNSRNGSKTKNSSPKNGIT